MVPDGIRIVVDKIHYIRCEHEGLNGMFKPAAGRARVASSEGPARRRQQWLTLLILNGKGKRQHHIIDLAEGTCHKDICGVQRYFRLLKHVL
jgi:hypothetical protein